MIAVHYPEPQFQLREEEGRTYLFDPLRKRWVVLTEEEWVRQNFIRYLVQEQGCPTAFIALEKSIRLFDRNKRFDILVYDAAHRPWMLVECKEPAVPLDDSVLQQVLNYGISVPVPYLAIVNGRQCFGWNNAGGRLQPLAALPRWPGFTV
ncbi:MAG TPA: type I restriction enzyme HsdR N-terminal domain-containing protein [Chitinophagaceae bacterium]|jgi:hypothetical protein|nr:type I restriction enzyme HsdR N-terminal domain-containing protein [Chitinophagaceae bacterium]